MTKAEAAAIRSAQLQGHKVCPTKLARAISVLNRKPRRKWDLPTIPVEDRHYMNSILCFRLGLAIGKK